MSRPDREESVDPIELLSLETGPRRPERSDYGIGIIGCGGIVNAAHLPAYRAAGLQIIGCFDVDRAAAEATAARFAIPRVYPSLDALLADQAVAIVDIAVPAWHQRGIAERALLAGKHLLCQKPLAETLDDALAIAHAGRRAGRHVAVNQQMRWSAGIAAARGLLRDGLIGTPTDVQIRVSVATPWHLWPWLRDAPRLDLMYHSIHYVDSVRSWVGDPLWVTSQHARFPGQPERAETRTITVLEYESGLHALVTVNHHDHSGASIAEFRILGTAGAIEGTIGLLADYPRARPDTLRFTSQRFVPHMWHAPTLTGLWLPDAFVGPMYGLMQAIGGDVPPPTDALDNCQTLRVVHAAYRSAAERRSVALAELS